MSLLRNPGMAVLKFCNSQAPFNTPEAVRCLHAYSSIQRLTELLRSEARSLNNALSLPEVDAEVPPVAKATISVCRHAFDVAVDEVAFGQACLAREREQITEAEFQDHITGIVANVMAIAFNTVYVARGVASTLTPVDYPHEIVISSAIRFEALANEVKALVGDSIINAMLAA